MSKGANAKLYKLEIVQVRYAIPHATDPLGSTLVTSNVSFSTLAITKTLASAQQKTAYDIIMTLSLIHI